MFIAGTLGPVLGDYASHDLKLGDLQGTYVLGAGLLLCFLAGWFGALQNLAFYWLTIVMVRAAGTMAGDYFASKSVLGLATSTVTSGIVFAVFLVLVWSIKRAKPAPALAT